jgi:hypothetical protein
MVNRSDEIEPHLAEGFTRQLQAAQAIVEGIPFMGIARTEGIGGEKHRHRHASGPVEGEGIHRIEHPVLHRVEELKLTHHILGAEGGERQFTAGFFSDTVTPVLEHLQPNTAWPGGLNLPGGCLGSDRRHS